MITEFDKFPPVEKTKPFPHQEEWFHKTKDHKYYGLWWEMGTGKTKVIIDTAVHLFNRGEIDGVLVIAPKGCYRNWSDTELPTHLPDNVPVRIAAWSSVMNKKQAYDCTQILTAQDNVLDFMCMNVEAFSSGRVMEVAYMFAKNHYAMLVIDESSCVKSMQAQRTKNILKLKRVFEYRRVMSGTPITQGPLDLYAQCEILAQGLLGFHTFTAFRFHYADIRTISLGSRSFPKLFGYRNLDSLYEKLQPFSSRLLKEECLDLPEKLYEIEYVDHSPEQSDAYYQMRDEALMMLSSGEMVSSTSALTTLMKLHQINCGHLKTDDGTIVTIPNSRIDALENIIERVNGKIIIWACFRYDIALISAFLRKRYGEGCLVEYHGAVPDMERSVAIQRFTSDANCRFFVGTAATGGRSITLVQAKTVIYYSNSYNLEHRLQSEDRAHRIGQKNPVLYVDIVIPKTVDEKIVKALRSKKDLAASILDDYRQLLD